MGVLDIRNHINSLSVCVEKYSCSTEDLKYWRIYIRLEKGSTEIVLRTVTTSLKRILVTSIARLAELERKTEKLNSILSKLLFKTPLDTLEI